MRVKIFQKVKFNITILWRVKLLIKFNKNSENFIVYLPIYVV